MLLGKRMLWDGESGDRVEEFQSAVVPRMRSHDVPGLNMTEAARDRAISRDTDAKASLNDEEMRWLFGYGSDQGRTL